MGPVPPCQRQQVGHHRRIVAIPQFGRRRARDDGIGCHVPCDDGTGCNDGTVANRDLWLDHRGVADPSVMTDPCRPRPAVRKEHRVVFGIIPVVGGAIQKVMHRRRVHRMIRRPDPHKGRDIGELADLRIGNIGVSVAIAVVIQMAVLDPTAAPDLAVAAKSNIRQLAIGVDAGVFGQACHHSPLISLRRNQPEIVSITITISTIRMI